MSMLGILKAGGVYVPVDTAAAASVENPPGSRTERDPCCPDCGGPAGRNRRKALGRDVTVPAAAKGSRAPISDGILPLRLGGLPGRPAAVHGLAGRPRTPPVYFGSTGAPKGVVITHANVMHFVEWATRYFSMHCSDRISGHPPLHFDLSTFDIYGTFAAGAQLHLVPPPSICSSHPAGRLHPGIRADAVVLGAGNPDPGPLQRVADGDFPALKRLLWCGECCPRPS